MTRAVRGALLAIFFLSGACALVYQVVWIRLFAVALGTSAYSLAAVLSTFMGGLALGSWIASRRVDRVRDLLRLYMVLELGISLFAMASPWLTDALFAAVAGSVANPELPMELRVFLRLLLVSLVLIVPTVLMGATLPVLSRIFVEREEETGRQVATLYFANTLGAATGAYVAGFHLLRLLGVRDSLIGAALVNIALAMGVLWLRQLTRAHAGEETPAPKVPTDDASEATWTTLDRRALLCVVGMSGFIALAYEVLWTRLLVYFVGFFSNSFATMLTAFLFGLALGSAIYAWLRRLGRFDPVGLLASLQFGTGLFAMLSIPAFGIVLAMQRQLDQFGFDVSSVRFATALFIMLPCTTLLGATLPAAMQVASKSIEGVGHAVGSTLAINTIGNVLGAFGATFLLIPLLGDARIAVLVLAVANVSLGCVVFWLGRGTARSRRRRWVPLGVLVGVIVAVLCLPSVPVLTLTGRYRALIEPEILWERQGVTTSAAVVDAGRPRERMLMINDVSVAERNMWNPYDEMLAYHGMLLVEQPRKVFVAGMASGLTSKAVLDFPELERIDSVEIAKEVIEALRYFDPPRPRVLSDPRSNVIWEDARLYLLGTSERYDVIISDAIVSLTTGTPQLVSKDYYELCFDRLTPGGVTVIAISAGRNQVGRMLYKTFHSVFPYVTAFQHDPDLIYLVGSKAPLEIDAKVVEHRFGYPRVATHFGWLGTRSARSFLRHRIPDDPLYSDLEDTFVITDDRPHLEFLRR